MKKEKTSAAPAYGNARANQNKKKHAAPITRARVNKVKAQVKTELRGGPRKGAGRPKQTDPVIEVRLYLHQSEIKALGDVSGVRDIVEPYAKRKAKQVLKNKSK